MAKVTGTTRKPVRPESSSDLKADWNEWKLERPKQPERPQWFLPLYPGRKLQLASINDTDQIRNVNNYNLETRIFISFAARCVFTLDDSALKYIGA